MSVIFEKIVAIGRAFGPYLAIELLMPGGSMIALVLWFLRNRQRR